MLASRAFDLVDKVRNYNEIPEQYSSLARKRRTLSWQLPFVRLFSRAPAPNGNDVVLEQHDFLSIELADVMYKQHVFVINVGHPHYLGIQEKRGGFRRVLKEKDAIFLLPELSAFFWSAEN